MNRRSLHSLFTLGSLALSLAACGDDGAPASGTAGLSEGDASSTDGETNPTTTSNSDSESNSASEPTEGGMSAGMTEATTGTTAPTTTDGTTMSVDTTGQMAECGNDIVEPGEACDDGNTEDGDECSADCSTATPTQVCGNGTIEVPETCDDGNMDPGDGCEPDCTETPADCGNGVVEEGEQCDDGNDTNGGPMDFCTNDCKKFVPPQCQAPATYEVCDDDPNIITDKNDKKNALRAIGICDLQPNNSIVTTAFEFDAQAQNNTWQVAKGFGTYTYDHDMDANTPPKRLYSPREGETFLMLSTGVIAPPLLDGVVTELPNSQLFNNPNFNSSSDVLPAPFKTAVGSNNGAGGTPFMSCDNGMGDRDCSDTLQAQWQLGLGNPNDRIYFTFKTVVPAGTFGYTFDFVFCSAEWPDFVNDPYNDLLIAYQVDPTPDDPNQNPPVDPYSGNVTFIPNPNNMMQGLPLTITALDPYYSGPGYTYAEPQLQGTGFEQHACSDWFSAKGGVQPGAEITVGFYLADMADANLATVALLDNFRWDCEGCIPSEVDDCGVQEPM